MGCGEPLKILNKAVKLEVCFGKTGFLRLHWSNLDCGRAVSLDAIVSQAGVYATLALVSHFGREEQGTNVRFFLL